MSRANRLLVAMERRTPGMITCAEFEDFIVDYLEQRLSLGARLRFRGHVLLCPACRRFLRRYQRTLELGRRVCQHPDDAIPADVPDDLVAAILAARRVEAGRGHHEG